MGLDLEPYRADWNPSLCRYLVQVTVREKKFDRRFDRVVSQQGVGPEILSGVPGATSICN